MTVRFWGVRGSRTTPGAHTLRYGGHTACVSVESDDAVLILDAGSGMLRLGEALAESTKALYLLLSHLHYDHLEGFCFFQPLYEPGRAVHVVDFEKHGQPWSAFDLFDGIHFPVRLEDLPSAAHRLPGDSLAFLAERGFEVERLPLNHPGGAVAYRIGWGERSLVYMTDNELQAPGPDTMAVQDFVAFCRETDVLIHDAQYLSKEQAAHLGWGHSAWASVCELAVLAQVRHLVLFHHDPERSDDELDTLQQWATEWLAPEGILATAAYEGLTLTL